MSPTDLMEVTQLENWLLHFPDRLMFRLAAEQRMRNFHSEGKSDFPVTTPLQSSMRFPLEVPAQPLISEIKGSEIPTESEKRSITFQMNR